MPESSQVSKWRFIRPCACSTTSCERKILLNHYWSKSFYLLYLWSITMVTCELEKYISKPTNWALLERIGISILGKTSSVKMLTLGWTWIETTRSSMVWTLRDLQEMYVMMTSGVLALRQSPKFNQWYLLQSSTQTCRLSSLYMLTVTSSSYLLTMTINIIGNCVKNTRKQMTSMTTFGKKAMCQKEAWKETELLLCLTEPMGKQVIISLVKRA